MNRGLGTQKEKVISPIGFLIQGSIHLFIHLNKGKTQRVEEDLRNKEDANEMRRKVLEWLSPDDLEETHGRYWSRRLDNTGQWLLDDPRFQNWRDEAQSSVIWCHGARKL